MAKLLYSATMSLDGFIAGPGGDMSWLADHLGPNPTIDGLIPRVGSILSGARSFRGDDPHRGTENEGEAFGGGWEGQQFVLTHHPPAEPVPGVTFAGDLDTAVTAARAAAGDAYVNVIGADVARQCIEAGLMDEVLVFTAPVLLGGGVRLFDRPGGPRVRLEQIQVSALSHCTGIWLRVIG